MDSSIVRGSMSFFALEEAGYSYVDFTVNKNGWKISFVWLCIYLIAVLYLKKHMKSRTPYSLNKFLLVWDTFLAVLNMCITWRMGTGLWIEIKEFGFNFSVCNVSFAKQHHPVIFWSGLLLCSKILELIDTLFILLRKRNLTFLHFFHHASAMVFTWYIIANEISTGYWFATINAFVLSVMYTYFALKTTRLQMPHIFTSVIVLEFLQMILGCFFTLWAFNQFRNGNYCEQTVNSLLFAGFIYGAHVVLVGHLFCIIYIRCLKTSEIKFNKSA